MAVRGGFDVGKSASALTSLSEPSESQAMPESTATCITRAVSPRNPNFIKLALHPRGIFINYTSPIVYGAFSHFGTSEPSD